MNLIETFGAKVGALSETNPQRARALLSAGFRANGVKNKVAGKKATKSDRMLFQLVNHAMVDCLANPQQNVMVSLFTPCEMLHLQGLHPDGAGGAEQHQRFCIRHTYSSRRRPCFRIFSSKSAAGNAARQTEPARRKSCCQSDP